MIIVISIETGLSVIEYLNNFKVIFKIMQRGKEVNFNFQAKTNVFWLLKNTIQQQALDKTGTQKWIQQSSTSKMELLLT